jgi:molybdenum cofactor cytidylyltransferase
MNALALTNAFGLGTSGLVSFVGGGGKTSLMFALAHELSGNVVVTTTTRIFAAQMKLAAAVCDETTLDELAAKLAKHRVCLVVGPVKGEKTHGVAPSLPAKLLGRPDVDYVLVEADGSRMRPVKAPARHEPVVPLETSLHVPVAGIDALGKPLGEVAHRPELVMQLLADLGAPLRIGDPLQADTIAALIGHPQGGLKGAPERARVVPFINKVETDHQLTLAHQIARRLLRQDRVDRVVLGAVKRRNQVRAVHSRVTAVVLAAGESTRMGQTKQLLPWGKSTVLGQTLDNLRQSAVHDILVVTGHDAGAVELIAREAGAQICYNAQYATGEMLSSLKAALGSLPEDRSAVLVVLADQPMVEPKVIDALLKSHWQGMNELVAPQFRKRRGNPVLIGRRFFPELMALPDGAAPRDVLRTHEKSLVLEAVDSDSVLTDLDLPEDYNRWRPRVDDRG